MLSFVNTTLLVSRTPVQESVATLSRRIWAWFYDAGKARTLMGPPNDVVEKASCDLAPVTIELQDCGIKNLWESMPGWPATRRSIRVRSSFLLVRPTTKAL